MLFEYLFPDTFLNDLILPVFGFLGIGLGFLGKAVGFIAKPAIKAVKGVIGGAKRGARQSSSNIQQSIDLEAELNQIRASQERQFSQSQSTQALLAQKLRTTTLVTPLLIGGGLLVAFLIFRK